MKQCLFFIFFLSASLMANALDLSKFSWQLRFDPTGKKSLNEIIKEPEKSWLPMLPGVNWRAQGFKFERNKKNGNRIVWHRCRFDLPGDFNAKDPVLHIGAVDDLDEAYLNGKKIGQTGKGTPSYWAVPRRYKIPKGVLRKKGNELLIKVTDLRGEGGISSLPVEIIDVSKKKNAVDSSNPMNMRTYSQNIEIDFVNKEEAKKAVLSFAPLPDNKEWVFSARWDDNRQENLKMRDLMDKYGYKGTFYLYSNYRSSKKGGKTGADYAKKLMKNGFSIGGHSMTHPPFTQITRNEMFYEVGAIKVEREVDTDTPLVSFAFPGGNFQSQFDRKAHPDIARALARCDFHHNTYSYFVNPERGVSPNAFSTVCNVVPGDRDSDCAKFDAQAANILKNKKLQKTNPDMTLGIHVWHTDKGWKNLEKSLKKYANNPKWLYCNQNVYAAYRYQFKHSKLQKISQDGAKVFYKLIRPNAGDLGDNIPLTVNVKNAKPVSAFVNGKKIALSGDSFNVPHDDKEKVPTIIDAVNNPLNFAEAPKDLSSGKMPGLIFFLYFDNKENCLKLRCKNKSGKAVADMHIRFRLPLLYRKGVISMELPGIKPGAAQTVRLPLPEKESSMEYRDGLRYFIAQIDFLYKNKICRFYATVREKKDKQDLRSCPRDTAIVSNPMTKNELALGELRRLSEPSSKLSGVIIPGWRKTDKKAGFKQSGKYVNIAPQGADNRKKCKGKTYFVAVFEDVKINKDNASIYCLTGKNTLAYVFLNGKKLEPSNRISGLKRGVNRLALVFELQDLKTTKLVLDFSPENEITLQRPF